MERKDIASVSACLVPSLFSPVGLICCIQFSVRIGQWDVSLNGFWIKVNNMKEAVDGRCGALLFAEAKISQL